MAKKKTAKTPKTTKPVQKLDEGFLGLLKSANAIEDRPKTKKVDPTVIGLFETALNSLNDAKRAIEQDRDARKDLLSAIEVVQFGISQLKKANK